MKQYLDSLQLSTMALYCLAFEQGSFTAAATAAGLSPAAVSRAIARLEAKLAVKLFVRTTRQISPTDAGRIYYARCRRALNELQEAEDEISGRQIEPEGQVRISLPVTYGHLRVLPLLPEFRAKYPHLFIDVNLSNRNVDFVSEGFDLAIRARTPPDSSLIARKIEDAELVVVASPSYLKKAGKPTSLSHLDAHECIQFELPRTGQNLAWSFLENNTEVEIDTQGHISCSEDLAGVVALAKHGAGLIQIYRFMVKAELDAGTLIEVLNAYCGRTRPFSILYPANRYLPFRVRALIDYLAAKLQS